MTTPTPFHIFVTDSIHIARRLWRFMGAGWTSQVSILLGPRARREIRLVVVVAPIDALAAASVTDQVVAITGISWRPRATATCLARRSGRFAALRGAYVAG